MRFANLFRRFRRSPATSSPLASAIGPVVEALEQRRMLTTVYSVPSGVHDVRLTPYTMGSTGDTEVRLDGATIPDTILTGDTQYKFIGNNYANLKFHEAVPADAKPSGGYIFSKGGASNATLEVDVAADDSFVDVTGAVVTTTALGISRTDALLSGFPNVTILAPADYTTITATGSAAHLDIQTLTANGDNVELEGISGATVELGGGSGNIVSIEGDDDPGPRSDATIDMGTGTGNVLDVKGGGTANFEVPQEIASVTIESGGIVSMVKEAPVTGTTGAHQLNKFHTLTIGGTGTLDVAKQDLLVDVPEPGEGHPHPADQIQGWLASGYNDPSHEDIGTWDGVGINSSFVAATWNSDLGLTTKTLGFAYGSDQSVTDQQPGGGANENIILDGVGANQVLIRPCLNGDMNMDGTVDFNDISTILAYGTYASTTLQAHYTDGDINYSLYANFDDISLLLGAANYNNTLFF